MYLRGNSIGMDDRRQTMDDGQRTTDDRRQTTHFKSFYILEVCIHQADFFHVAKQCQAEKHDIRLEKYLHTKII
jgi:hypothetical protein